MPVTLAKKDHKDLWQIILNKIEGKACLSYYDFPQILEWYPESKWRIETTGCLQA